jgi:hypothetical protein
VLLRGGVPFHIAFPSAAWLTPEEQHALAIVLLELEGGRFDWDSLSWMENA